jgi:hypothetical protein
MDGKRSFHPRPFGRSGLFGAVVSMVAFLSASGCDARDMTLEGKPKRLYGDIFLRDPADRTKVDVGPELAAAFQEIVKAGKRAGDLKDQGWAVLSVDYDGDESVKYEVTASGLVRYGGRVVQVDREKMMDLLNRVLADEEKPK